MTIRIAILLSYLVMIFPLNPGGDLVLCKVPDSRDIHVERQHHACARTETDEEHHSHSGPEDARICAKERECFDIPFEIYALPRPDERPSSAIEYDRADSDWSVYAGYDFFSTFGSQNTKEPENPSFSLLSAHTTVLII